MTRKDLRKVFDKTLSVLLELIFLGMLLSSVANMKHCSSKRLDSQYFVDDKFRVDF